MRNPLLAALAAMATLALVSCGVPSTPVFVEEAASSDLYEVAAGKLASEKGQSEAVKTFGRHMVEAHSKTTEELKGIVQSEKLDVTLPTELNKKQQSMLNALTEAKPEAFDHALHRAADQGARRSRGPVRQICRAQAKTKR